MSKLLGIGVSGLGAAKRGVKTTSHNISNVRTEGFTKKRIIQQSRAPLVSEGLIEGRGAEVRNIERSSDLFVEKRLNFATTNNNFSKEKARQLDQIERIFNELDTDGLNKALNEFYNSFRELAARPEDEILRSVVRENARLVIKDFKKVRADIDNLTSSIDNRMGYEVKRVNTILENIAKLNKDIFRMELSGEIAGDLRDGRDLLVNQLSGFFKTHTYEDGRGQYNIHAVGVGSVVTGGHVQSFDVKRVPVGQSSNDNDGSFEIFFGARPSEPVSSRVRTGLLGAMLNVRNEVHKGLREGLDDIVYNLVQSVNAVHRRGYVNRTLAVGEDGIAPGEDSVGATTGVDFFASLSDKRNASLRFDLSESVKGDLTNIATALDPNSPGDNRIAVAISKLQHETLMDNGTTTLEEHYLKQVGRIGFLAHKTRMDREHSDGLLAQTADLRERISGVNLDEEAVNLAKYRHAYEASAKVMKTAEEMMDTILELKS